MATARTKRRTHVDNHAINTISLFSGVGMLDEGLHAGLAFMGIRSRTILFAEREAYPVAVLEARMQEGSIPAAPIWFGDLCELDAKQFFGVVDCVVAGFPCQDLSLAGRRAGLDGKRSGLFFEVTRIARDCGARYLFLENVAGIASATATVVDEAEGTLDERAASRVLGELADLGWHAEWATLSASDVGASHGRARWFCWAWREPDDTTSPRPQKPRQTGERELPTQAGTGLHHRPQQPSGEVGYPGLQHQHLQQREDGTEHSGASCSVADTECSCDRTQEQAAHCGWDEAAERPADQHSRLCGPRLFAPGPNDPTWPGIIQNWPHLAPALAGESGSARLNPCFVEFLMGWPIFWTHTNVDQTDDQKASAARSTNEWRTLLQMRLSEWFDAPSRGLQQATGSGNHVSVLPRNTSRRGSEAETSGMQDLQGTVHANPNKALGHLPETGMQSRQGSAGCREAMGQQTADGSMQLLQVGVHKNAATPNNVQQIVRKQVGLAEQAMSNRPQRLKCCGNGVVPAQASYAACILIARAKGVI